jgi:hypothetical protein
MYTLSDESRVRDRVRVVAGGEALELRVDADAMRMVLGLNDAQRRMRALKDGSTEDELRDTAMFFAGVIFGRDQASALAEFYSGDPGSIIRTCGRYFSERLAGKIEDAQKRGRQPAWKRLRRRLLGW